MQVSSAIGISIVSKSQKDGVKVLISRQMADEMFGGYGILI